MDPFVDKPNYGTEIANTRSKAHWEMSSHCQTPDVMSKYMIAMVLDDLDDTYKYA